MFAFGDKNKFIGLDIGHSHLSAVRIKNNTVVEVGEYPLARGIIDKGQVKDVASLAETIKRFWSDMGLKSKKVQFSICTPKAVVTLLNTPILDSEDELRQVVRFNIADRLSYDAEEAVIDYTVAEDEAVIRDRNRLIVAAAPKSVVNGYIAAVRRAKLDIVGIQLIPFVLPQSVKTSDQGAGQDSIDIICHMGSDITSIGIVHKRDCLFARFSTMAGQTITDKIQEGIKVPIEEAERLKCALGLSETPKDDKESKAQSITSGMVDTLGQEIHETVAYYQEQEENTSYPVAQLILSGGGAYLKGLPQYLEAILGTPVRLAEPKADLAVHEQEYYGRWALAYGLSRSYKALEGGNKVQGRAKKEKKGKSDFFSFKIGGKSLGREKS